MMTSEKLKAWMVKWYAYSSEDSRAEAYPEFLELRKIIKEIESME